MEIILQSVLAALDYSTMQLLANDVSKEFKNTKVTVGSSLTQSDAEMVFQSDFDRNRNQWNSPKLLRSLSEKYNRDIDTKTLKSNMQYWSIEWSKSNHLRMTAET
jgi:hypothetical protein